MSEVSEFDFIFGFFNSVTQGTSLLEWAIAFLIFNTIAMLPKGEASKNLSEMADFSIKEKISKFEYLQCIPTNFMRTLLLGIVLFIVVFISGVLLYLPLLLIEFASGANVISSGFSKVALVFGLAVSMALVAKK
jgi:TM2 domain-containing membrane protein YozV